MEFLDFFFPQQAGASHLRTIAQTMRHQQVRRRGAERRLSEVAGELEDDVSLLALTLMSVVGSLIEKGVLTEADLHAQFRRLDGLDGVADGKLTPDALRGALGLPRTPDPEPEAPKPTPPPTPKDRRRRRR